jgi:hypothetical protein
MSFGAWITFFAACGIAIAILIVVETSEPRRGDD